MKNRFWMAWVGVCLSLAGAGTADAASYYLNDAYVPGTDVYTTAAGNDANAGTTPGRFYTGHGLIQITGFNNHVACGLALGIDAKHEPKRLTIPVYAARSAGWFWKANELNTFADAGDFDGVCDKINRGRKTARIGDSNGWAQRLAFYEAAKEVLC